MGGMGGGMGGGGMGGGMMSVPPVDPQVPAGDDVDFLQKKSKLIDALEGNPTRKSSPNPQGQSGTSPAGPSSLSKPRDDGPTIRPGSSGAGQDMAPLIRPRGASGQTLIPIEPRAAGVVKSGSGGHTDPYAFWMSYFRTKDEKKIRARDAFARPSRS